MIKHCTQLRIRYAETDQMGYVYHGNYLEFMEVARVEWLRDIGISYKEMEQENTMLPVVSISINYRKPALYDELILIETKLSEIPSRKIVFEYIILNQNNETLVTATSTLVFVDKFSRKPTQCPKNLMDKILSRISPS